MLDHMPVAAEGAGADEIIAPMPGQITRILVEVGDEVVEGQDVAIIEACLLYTSPSPRDS